MSSRCSWRWRARRWTLTDVAVGGDDDGGGCGFEAVEADVGEDLAGAVVRPRRWGRGRSR